MCIVPVTIACKNTILISYLWNIGSTIQYAVILACMSPELLSEVIFGNRKRTKDISKLVKLL